MTPERRAEIESRLNELRIGHPGTARMSEADWQRLTLLVGLLDDESPGRFAIDEQNVAYFNEVEKMQGLSLRWKVGDRYHRVVAHYHVWLFKGDSAVKEYNPNLRRQIDKVVAELDASG